MAVENNTEATTPFDSSPKSYVWYVVFLLSIVNIFNYMDRSALSVLAPAIQADLSLSDGQIGLLIGFAFALFYAVCAVPIGRLADRGNRRNIVAIALAVWSLMTAVTGAAQTFWHVFMARLGVGAGEAGGLAPAQNILCDYVPLERRASVLSIHSLGGAVGAMLGMGLAGWLGETIGWRLTFLALGLPGLALALIVRTTLREPKRGEFDAPTSNQDALNFSGTIAFLLRSDTYRMLLIYSVVGGLVNFGLGQWWPTFYTRVHGLSITSIGLYFGVVTALGGAAGTLSGGFFADFAQKRSAGSPLVIGAFVSMLAMLAVLAALFAPSAPASILFNGVFVFLWSLPIPGILAALYNVAKPAMRSTAATISFLLSSGVGLGLGPFIVGVLSDALASSFGAQSLRYALIAPTALIPIVVLALFAAGRSLPKELATRGAAPHDGSATCTT